MITVFGVPFAFAFELLLLGSVGDLHPPINNIKKNETKYIYEKYLLFITTLRSELLSIIVLYTCKRKCKGESF
jgi:hypothetical protein